MNHHDIQDASTQQHEKKYRDRSGAILQYIDEKELQALYPNGGYKILADIHPREKQNTENILADEHAKIGLYPYEKKQSWIKYVFGYVPVVNETGEEGFVRILKIAWYRPLSILLVLLVSSMIFLIGVQFAQKEKVAGLDETAVSYHIDGVRNNDKDSILLPGLSVLYGTVKNPHIKAALINPDGNECYFIYTIQLKDTAEILYTSGLIGPGKAVLEFDLNGTLPEGKYPIKVSVETRDLNDQDIVYNAGNIDAHLVITK